MILVVGFEGVNETSLPMNEVIDYKVVPIEKEKLVSMLAQKEDCSTVFIHKNHQATINIDSIAEKVVFINNISEIETIVKGGEISATDLTSLLEEVESKVEDKALEIQALEASTNKEDDGLFGDFIQNETTPMSQNDLKELENEINAIEVTEEDSEREIVKLVTSENDTENEKEKETDVALDLNTVIQQKEEKAPITWVDDNIEEIKKEYELKLQKAQEQINTLTDNNMDLISKISGMQSVEHSLKATINNLESQLTIVNKKLDSAVHIAESRLKQQQESFNAKVRSANETIQDLSRKLMNSSIKESAKKCEVFSDYTGAPKAVVKVAMTEAERIRIGVQNSVVNLMTVKGTDSLILLQDEVVRLLEANKPCLIVDFTGDLYMNNKYGIRAQTSCLDIEKFPITDVVMRRGNVDFVPTTSFNDVCLLTMNWDVIMNKLFQQASGRPIILLFNDAERFSTKFVLSKLGDGVGNVSVVVKTTPYNLTTVQVVQMYLPHIEKKLLLLDYTQAFKDIIKQLGNHYKLVPLDKEINWSNLGL